MKNLSLDLETYSSVDLAKSGLYRYAESSDFEILLLGYSVDGGEVQVVDLASGEKLPAKILDALTDDSVQKWAFNSSFERVCLSRYLGAKYLNTESWRCTMVWAAYMGLPLSLMGVGAVLGLEKQKLSEGKDLIKYFCAPCAPTKSNGQRRRNLPEHAPEKWATFKAYNIPIIYKGENRYKGVFTGRKKYRYKGKWRWKEFTYYGWIAKSALQYTLTEDWPNDPAAIETVAPAWIVADQLFRIYKVELRDDGVTAYARHIFYDLLNNLTSFLAGQTSCVDAVDGILGYCLVPTQFSGFTDVGGERVIDGWTRVNPVSALLDPETGAAALWGAEIVRDNYDFFLLRDAGLNRGVRIEYAKNLLGVSCEVDASDVVTRIVPVGKDKSGKDLLLAPGSYNVDGTVYTIAADQTWIDSPLASLYPAPHVQALICSGECKETKTVSKTAVRTRMIREALAALANDADLPKVSLKVEFLSLGDTEEYAQYRSLEDVFLYDRVRVKHPGIQLDVLTEVNRVEFDCLGEKFRSIELGSVRQDMRKTAVASWQLPSTISGRKIAMESISAAQLEPESVEEIDLSLNGSVIGVAEQTVGITLAIVASRGGVLTTEVPETVLTARVLRGATDLTASYDASRFSWTRSSPDTYGDTLWNALHRGTKTITVTAADVKRQAVFYCTLEGE